MKGASRGWVGGGKESQAKYFNFSFKAAATAAAGNEFEITISCN